MQMTVKMLIEELKRHDENAPVFFSYNYGDHCRTTAAEPVRKVRERDVVEWAYGNCHRVIDRFDEDETETEEATGAVVLA